MRIRGRVTAVIGLSSSSQWRQNKRKGEKKRSAHQWSCDKSRCWSIRMFYSWRGANTANTSHILDWPISRHGGRGLIEYTVYLSYVGYKKKKIFRSDKNIYVHKYYCHCQQLNMLWGGARTRGRGQSPAWNIIKNPPAWCPLPSPIVTSCATLILFQCK